MQQAAGRERRRASRAYDYLEEVEVVPGCLQKASVYRESLDGLSQAMRDALVASDVPAEVEALIEATAALSDWVPEAHAHAYFLAVAELCQPTEVAFLRAGYAASTRLLQSPTYRQLLRMAPPQVVLRTTTRIWQLTHRGSALTVASQGARGALLRLCHPRHHLTPTIARMYAVSFAASFDLAGTEQPRVDLDASTPTETSWRIAWS